MKSRDFLAVAAILASIAALGMPALAGSSAALDDTTSPRMRHNGHGMMSGGMMSGGMMSGGCSSMMQSMNNGGGRPNEQWRTRPPEGRGTAE